MSSEIRHIVLYLCLIACVCTHAQVNRNPVFIINQEENSLKVDFTMGDYKVLDTGKRLVRVEANGMETSSGRPGGAALPEICRLVALPKGSRIAVDRITAASDTLLTLADGLRLCAVPFATPKDGLTAELSAVGDSDGVSTHRQLQVESLGTLGENDLFRLRVCPFAWSRKDNILKVSRRLLGRLTVTPPSQNTYKPRQQEALILLAADSFRTVLQPFVRWKRQEGYLVHEVYSHINKRDSLKTLVKAAATSIPDGPPPYLLLVGDSPLIPPFIGTAQPQGFDNHVTDLYYAVLDDDYLPDLKVGRWPVNDSAELSALVEKTLRYEQWLDADTTARGRVILVAGEEYREPAPTTNGHVNYLGNLAAQWHSDIDTFGFRNPASGSQLDSIMGLIGYGADLLSYTAHCTTKGWSRPGLQAEQLDSLDNAPAMVWVNNCCMSNNFSGSCFGEQLLRKKQGGSVATIGATNNTMWNEDFYWAVGPKYPFSVLPTFDSLRPGAFDGLLGYSGTTTTVGDLLLAGNLSVSAFGSPYDKFYWEIYCLLGDPTLRPHLGMPTLSSLEVVAGMTCGSTTLGTIATPGALVTAVQADSLLGTSVADSNGKAEIALRWGLDTGSVILTVSGSGLIPRTVQSLPLPAESPLAIVGIQCTDSTITATVANLGIDTLSPVSLTLYQDSADLGLGAKIGHTPSTLDTLLPGKRQNMTVKYTMTQIGEYPLWQATLKACSGTMQASIPLCRPLHMEMPIAEYRLLDKQSAPAHNLTPSTHYALHIGVQGLYDSMKVALTALPGYDDLACTTLTGTDTTLSFLTPSDFTHLLISSSLYTGKHVEHHWQYLVAGHRIDSFEEGFDSYPWSSGGTLPWQPDPDTCLHGKLSLRSGPIDYRQTSDLTIIIHVLSDDTVRYWARTSSEAQHDRLVFTIDGTAAASQLSGESGWRQFNIPITAGRHTLRWRYVKDETENGGADCAWIDDVQLPLALWDTTYGWFGHNDSVAFPAIETLPITLYPNPTDRHITVQGIAGCDAIVVDKQGRELFGFRLDESSLIHTLDLGCLDPGIYFLKLMGSRHISTHKIIIHYTP